jgi:hypothetical protein
MNKLMLGLGGLALLAAVPSLGNAKGTMGQFQEMREQSANGAADHARLMLEQEEIAATAEIAVQRYIEGCQPVVDWDQINYVSLVENEVVLDPTTRFPIPAGTVVCDANGNTAIIRENDQGWPVAQSFAFTGDQGVVRQRLSQFPQFQDNMIINGQEVSYDRNTQP